MENDNKEMTGIVILILFVLSIIMMLPLFFFMGAASIVLMILGAGTFISALVWLIMSVADEYVSFNFLLRKKTKE